MDAVASAPTPTGAEPPWLAITLAAIAVIGPVAVAYVPVISENRKVRSAQQQDPQQERPAVPPPPASPPPTPPNDAMALLREVLADALAQRDAANERAGLLGDELNQARVYIARLETRERRYGP